MVLRVGRQQPKTRFSEHCVVSEAADKQSGFATVVRTLTQ